MPPVRCQSRPLSSGEPDLASVRIPTVLATRRQRSLEGVPPLHLLLSRLVLPSQLVLVLRSLLPRVQAPVKPVSWQVVIPPQQPVGEPISALKRRRFHCLKNS